MEVIAIADHRISPKAKTKLEAISDVVYLQSAGITYESVSGHPDIFFCNAGEEIVFAPNVSVDLLKQLKDMGVRLKPGYLPVGEIYPESARYNAVITDKYFIHNLNSTDPVLRQSCSSLQAIHVNQGYTRCSVIPLSNDSFVTSDRGIEKTLSNLGLDVLYINPEGILLPGQKHGFIGGTCGIVNDKLIFLGSLKHYPWRQRLSDFLIGYEVIELYDGPLFDGGSLIFII